MKNTTYRTASRWLTAILFFALTNQVFAEAVMNVRRIFDSSVLVESENPDGSLSTFDPLNATFEIEPGIAEAENCDPVAYTIDFGDRTPKQSGVLAGTTQVSHTYDRPGTYTVAVEATREQDPRRKGGECENYNQSAEITITLQPPESVRYIGSDGDWFNAENWQGKRVPGADNDVEIAGDITVIIDPARGESERVAVRDIILRDSARLETMPGTVLTFRKIIPRGDASIMTYSSVLYGTAIMNPNWGCPMWRCGMNPSFVSLDSFIFDGEFLVFYLGGTEPAGPEDTGAGRHTFITTNSVKFTGTAIQVATAHGFEPQPGDEFVIMEARESLDGLFTNAEDGDEVARFGDVAIIVRYDNNRIILIAQSTEKTR